MGAPARGAEDIRAAIITSDRNHQSVSVSVSRAKWGQDGFAPEAQYPGSRSCPSSALGDRGDPTRIQPSVT